VREPEIVTIPGGPVRLGEPEFPASSELHPWTARVVEVPAFGIAKYAVTVGEYLEFNCETGYARGSRTPARPPPM
jgi:formylglycine-generating enzyme required for sulfatase activity